MPKFGWIPKYPDGSDAPYEYANVWSREKTSGPDRLIIAPRADQVGMLRKLCGLMQGPYSLLYILVVSRINESRLGRYESPYVLDSEQLQAFLSKYQEYLESDARHHLWIYAPGERGMLVYDNHNVIYGYGPLDRFVEALESLQLNEIEHVRFPVPHSHYYNAEFDDYERAITTEFEWKISPLQESDS